MSDLFPDLPLLSAFLAASFVLAVTPGPGVFYIVARSVSEGRKAGLASVVGVAAGNLGNAIGASASLAAVFAISQLAFEVVRAAGVLYLLFLAWRVLRGYVRGHVPEKVSSPRPGCQIALDGFLVALLNPKTALFFAAYLPQFVSPDGGHALQPVLLGMLFVAMAAVTDVLYVVAASRAAPVFARTGRVVPLARCLQGFVYLGLAAYAGLADTRSQR